MLTTDMQKTKRGEVWNGDWLGSGFSLFSSRVTETGLTRGHLNCHLRDEKELDEARSNGGHSRLRNYSAKTPRRK